MTCILKRTCNRVYSTVSIAVWTIIQTLCHLYSLSYIIWWTDCEADKSLHFFNFILGNRVCDNGTYDNIMSTNSEDTITDQLHIVIIVYIVLDALWIVTSVGLLMGACCRITEVWALAFYLPWAAMNGLILVYDIFCTVLFGLHLPNYGTFFDWLSLIGLSSQLGEIKTEDGTPDIILGATTIIMTFISARGVIIWIANFILLIVVVKIALKEYKLKHVNDDSNRSRKNVSIQTNSERIRNWHMHYDTLRYNSNNEDPNSEKVLQSISYIKEPVRVKIRGTLPIITYHTTNSNETEPIENPGGNSKAIEAGTANSPGDILNILETYTPASNATSPSNELPSYVPRPCVDDVNNTAEESTSAVVDVSSQGINNMNQLVFEDSKHEENVSRA